ncbi:hypothetical protein ABPG72_016114 [Tetrahymena utriculariae]
MPSLTQREEQTILRYLANIYSFIYLRDFEKRSSQHVRGVIIYCWYFIQMTGLFVLCSKHNLDQDSFTNTSQGSSSANIFGLWMKLTIYSRFNPILQYFSTGFIVPTVYLALLFFLDILFIYFFALLAKKSTKIHENNYKLNYDKIMFLGLYIDLFRWFLMQLKTEIIFAKFLCTYPSQGQAIAFHSSNQQLCSYLPSFQNLSSGESSTITVLCILNILSLIVCLILVFLINHSAEFIPSNPFKSKYSEVKFLEYPLIVITQYLAFYHDNTYVFIFINIKIAYYLFEYVSFFPLYRADLTGYYLKIFGIFLYCSILMTLREFTNYIQESFHLEILFIGSSFIYGFLTVLYQQINIHILSIKLSDEPVSYPNIVCQHFYEILQLYQKIQDSDSQAKLVLHGILTSHQSTCVDTFCPCQYDQERIDRELGQEKVQEENQEVKNRKKRDTVSHKQIEEVIEAKLEKADEEEINGVYFTDLMNKQEQFQKWLYEFINYHFRYLIFKSKKERNFNIEDLSIKYWFFLVNDRHNIINGLYTIKSQLEEFTSKSYFIKVIDIAITRFIENNIKQKDKSLKYSFRKKDMEEAIQYEVFEQFVLSEVIKDSFKKDLILLLEQKVNLMQSMIEGYEELETMQNQMITLIDESIRLENVVKSELSYSQQNLYYLKMLSILRIRVQNDPIFATKIEKKVDEIHAKSLAQDQNLIHSITVLNGNVISIISSFKKEKGKILKYSERTPQFFGYKKTAFDSSVKSILQLMPSVISTNHDQIIERLIVDGTPKIMRRYRIAIAKDKEGFLFPIKIYVNYYFQINDDFVFSALILKLTSQSSYLLLNTSYHIEGTNKSFLQFFNQLDENVTKELLDKIPIQLFLPDIPETIKKFHQSQLKMEGLKLPMIIPENCSKYFMGYKSYLKKMQGRDYSDSKLVENFMSQSKKFFKEDVYIFDWTVNVVQEDFNLLNGFSFTVFLIEIQNIQPIQIIQNGLKTTMKTNTEQDSFIPNKSVNTTSREQQNYKNNKKSQFDFNSTMFTHQYSQGQIKKKFHFKQGQSINNDTLEFNSDQKTIHLSSRQDITPQRSPQENQNDNILQQKYSNNSSVIQLEINMKENEEKKLNSDDNFKKQTSILKKENNISFSLDNTDQYLNPNKNQGQRYDEVIDMTEEEINKLRRSYDEIDAANAHGTTKQLPNSQFPARMELINNQQLCVETNRSSLSQQQEETQENNIQPQQQESAPAEQVKNQKATSLTKSLSKQDIGQQSTTDQFIKLKSCEDASGVKFQKQNANSKEVQQKNRMSVIQEQYNDSEPDKSINSFNKIESQNNLITQQFATENVQTDQNLNFTSKISPVLKGAEAINFDSDAINITVQVNNMTEVDRVNQPLNNSRAIQQPQNDNGDEYDQENDANQDKNKNCANFLFNSQQVLTRGSSYEKDGNPVLMNLQFLRESTKYSHHKPNQSSNNNNNNNNNVDQESDAATLDKDNQQQSFENESTLKEEVKLKPTAGNQNANSVASSQSSQVSTTIQRIYYSAQSKKMPFFMSLFFQVIGFQLLFFCLVCAVVCLIFNSQYSTLNDLTNQLDISIQILTPYSQNLLSIDAFSLSNEKFINFTEQYLQLSNETQSSSLKQLQSNIFDFIDQSVQYNFQNQYLSTIIEAKIQSNGTQVTQNLYFFESIKQVFENIYYLSQIPHQNIKLYFDEIYNLKMNYYPIEQVIQDQIKPGTSSQIHSIENSIDYLNQNFIIVSCCLLFFCFAMLIYPFWRYSIYVKGVLLSVSRMTEKEAEQEIILCRFIVQLMKSVDEKYLSIKYTNFDINQIQNEDLGISSHFNQQIKNKTQKNHMKKNYMLSQRINNPKIKLYHFALYFTGLFIFSITIFIIAFSIISKFNNSLNPALDTYQNYVYSLQKYSSFAYAADQVFTQRVIRIFKSQFGVLEDSFITTLNKNRMQDLRIFTEFFQSEFLYLTERNIFSSSFNSYINQIQNSSLCLQTSVFTNLQAELCQKAMNSVMQQGLNVVISKISDDVGQKQIDQWSDQLVIDSINLLEYENQLQVIQLTYLILLQIQQKMLNDIKTLINSYTQQIILIYSLGGIFYAFAFIIVCFSVYQNIYRRFFLIKKTVHLMPYKRLQEDQTTINLIKNALEG